MSQGNPKITVSKLMSEQRDQMKRKAVRARPVGYQETLGATDTRFNGRATHFGDRKLALEARAMQEPDWSSLHIDDLITAEKMTLHRLSGGESLWKPILERIREAKRAAERKNRSNR